MSQHGSDADADFARERVFRREVLHGLKRATEDPSSVAELIGLSQNRGDARGKLAERLECSEVVADAILDQQLAIFLPESRSQLDNSLRELD